jgi:hypothetical protein
MFAPAGSLRSSTGKQTKPSIALSPLLVDTGADITCISPALASQLNLTPSGKAPVVVPTGQATSNTYLVDIGVPFGNIAQGADLFVLENVTVMEFQGNNPNYQGLVGRDIICRGFYLMAGYDKRFTFCL